MVETDGLAPSADVVGHLGTDLLGQGLSVDSDGSHPPNPTRDDERGGLST